MTPPPNNLPQQMVVRFGLSSPSYIPQNGTVLGGSAPSPWPQGSLGIGSGEQYVTIPVAWQPPAGPGWQGMVSVDVEPGGYVDKPLFQDYPHVVQLLAGAVVQWFPISFSSLFSAGFTADGVTFPPIYESFPGFLAVGIQLAEFPGYTHGGGVQNQTGLVYPQSWYIPFQTSFPLSPPSSITILTQIVAPGSPTFPNLGGNSWLSDSSKPPWSYSMFPFDTLARQQESVLFYVDRPIYSTRGWTGSEWAYAFTFVRMSMDPAGYELMLSNLTLSLTF